MPVIGPFYAEVISGHTILVYVALLLVPASWWVLYRTRFGLRLRAVGENPAAVDTAGVSVVRLRYTAVMITGVLCGLAGAYMATGLSGGLRQGDDGGAGLYRAGRADLRQVAALVLRCGPDAAVRVPAGAGAAA